MAKAKRNIGREILEGLRELKRGEYGRVINIPDVASIRTKTGLSQAQFAKLMGYRCGPCRTGSKGAAHRQVLHGRFCLSQAAIPAGSLKWRRRRSNNRWRGP